MNFEGILDAKKKQKQRPYTTFFGGPRGKFACRLHTRKSMKLCQYGSLLKLLRHEEASCLQCPLNDSEKQQQTV